MQPATTCSSALVFCDEATGLDCYEDGRNCISGFCVARGSEEVAENIIRDQPTREAHLRERGTHQGCTIGEPRDGMVWLLLLCGVTILGGRRMRAGNRPT